MRVKQAGEHVTDHLLQVTTPRPGSDQSSSVEVLLDGQDIANHLRGLNIDFPPFPGIRRAVLDLGIEPMYFSGWIHIDLTERTQEILKLLGWRAPEPPA